MKWVHASWALLLMLGCSAPVWADWKWEPLFDLHVTGSSTLLQTQYPTIVADVFGNTPETTQQSRAVETDFYFAPNFTPGIQGLWITPSLSFEYAGNDRLLTIDDETFYFSKHATLYYQLGGNYEISRDWLVKLKGFGQAENVSQIPSEPMDGGVFSYRDWGAWAEVVANLLGAVPLETRAGYKYFTRRYPYYSNPFSAVLPQALHEYDADYQTVWLTNEYVWLGGDLKLRLDVRSRWVNYTAMPVFSSTGRPSDQLRQDHYWDFLLEAPWQITDGQDLKAGYGLKLRQSNQNIFDGSVSAFLPNYYDYRQHNLKLEYDAELPMDWGEFPVKAGLLGAGQFRQYLSRPSRQTTTVHPVSGEYNFSDLHWENSFTAGVSLKRNFFYEWFALVASYNVTWQYSNSNVEDNPYYTYNYRYQIVNLGGEVSF